MNSMKQDNIKLLPLGVMKSTPIREWTSKKYFWLKFFTNKYVKHGQMYEHLARESFASNTGQEVIECGMIISPENKWLGFSPDSMVLNSDRNPIALLQIKCLYSGNYLLVHLNIKK